MSLRIGLIYLVEDCGCNQVSDMRAEKSETRSQVVRKKLKLVADLSATCCRPAHNLVLSKTEATWNVLLLLYYLLLFTTYYCYYLL